ncbi:glycosyltransferase [Phocaeicola sp.]
MRILFYCDTVFSFGGVQRVLAEIAKALSKEHEVTILTTDTHMDLSMYGYDRSSVRFDFLQFMNSPLMENLICKGYGFLYKYMLPHVSCTSAVYGRSFFLPVYKRQLVEKVNKGNYDVVIGVHAFCALHLASIRNKVHAGKVMGWMHNSYGAFFEKKHPYLSRLKGFFKYQMSVLDDIVVLSGADKKKYEECLKLSPKVIFNPLTVDVKGRADLQSRQFLSVGRFSKGHKGFDLLIKAFASFAGRHTSWKLHLVGEGPEEKLYRLLIAEYELEDRIKIHPFTKDIYMHYLQNSVYVLASRWEGMPLVLMEAMAYGLPVVASDIPICKELLEGKGAGVLFKTENVEDLADSLSYMATGANLKSMSDKAVAYAECFKMDRIIKQWEEIIN